MKTTCATCGDASVWRDLPALTTLSASEVNAHVIGWPAGAVVEVRACRRCGRRLARKTSARCELG
jgi:hypothetical protein